MKIKSIKHSAYTRVLFLLLALLLCKSSFSQTGTWVALPQAPDNSEGGLTLLTDGRVISHTDVGGTYGMRWDRLTPDSTGSYINGVWDDTMAPMMYDRIFFSTQVLNDGRVYIAGGEYGTGATHAEVYNPLTNIWTQCGAPPTNWNIYDGNSEMLPNGDVLEGPQIGSHPSFDCLFYSPTTNLFTIAPSSFYNHDEAQWIKLPDSSILFVGLGSIYANRYIPSYNKWVKDDSVPVDLYDIYGFESGACILLPNGKAIFFGATGHNALYTPSGDTNPGVWTAAADFPKVGTTQVGQVDAPAAMMVNGRILCSASPIGTGPNIPQEFHNPVYFFEYDYTVDKFTQVTANIPTFGCDSLPGMACSQTNMIDLPDGNVLLAINQTTIPQGPPSPIQYFIYKPATAPIASGKPTITSIYENNCTYYITGKLFNGISEGAGYGDDWQMETNYPLVRLTNAVGHVYYARTTSWNRIGAVMTDSLADTAQFTLSAAVPAGTYSVVVVANGFASNPTVTTFNPFVVTPSIISNISCDGTVMGNAKALVRGGSGAYTYSWSNGAVVSTADSTGAILAAGSYTVTIMDAAGCSATAGFNIVHEAIKIKKDSTGITSAGACDGRAWVKISGASGPFTYVWSPGGASTDTLKNLCSGNYCCTVTAPLGCSSSTCIDITTGIIPIIVNSNAIHIFPNPTSGSLTMDGITPGQTVELYNYLGEKISHVIADHATLHLDISAQANGMYLVRILNKDATLAGQKKIVKTN